MSLTPLDESRGTSPSQPTEGEPTDTLVGRLGTALREAVRALVPNGPAGSTTDESSESTPALEPADRRRTERGSSTRREPERGQLELVTTETDERLTVSDADNPDAKISSDTWERVER